jgi:hypothetical protein
MVTLRFTKKLQKFLGVRPNAPLQPSTAALGDWYANLVPTYAGDLILFVNERSLLSVVVPAWESQNLIQLLLLRIANLFAMIGIDPLRGAPELYHFDHIQIANTQSRSILGSMNDFASQLQYWAEPATRLPRLSLQEAESRLSETPCGALRFAYPREVAKRILNARYSDA